MANLGTGNDNINIDGATSEFVDFGGTDTYTILSSLSGDVTITDNQASTFNLPGGLTITDAAFLADGVQFTINGFTLTLIGNPSLFTFVFGGTPLDPTDGTPQTFEETAVAFGTTVPAAGEPANTATTTGEINGDGTVGTGTIPDDATFALAADAAAVDEGATATFTVTTTNVAEGTEVGYTISGVDAADVTGGLTGTATVGADGTATISVALAADELTEGAETLTVTMDDDATATADVTVNDTSITGQTLTLTESSDQISEGETNAITATLNAAATEDTTVTFQLAPGDATAANQGTNTTNLNDFAGGAFNPVNATIKAGETSVTFGVTALTDGITELPETYTVSATLNGVTKSETSTILDGVVGNGQTYNLTKIADTTLGNTAFGDTYVASIIDTGGGETTLNPGDILNGGAGEDVLSVSISGNAGAGGTTTSAVTASDIETLRVTNFETNTGVSTISAALMSDLTKVEVNASGSDGDTSVTNLSKIVEAGMNNGDQDLTLSYNSAVLDGTTDVQKLGVSNQTGGTFTVSDSNGSAAETLEITSSGASANTLTVADANNHATIKVSGDQKLSLNINDGSNTTKTVDASAATGGVVLSGLGTTDLAFTGGTGMDVLRIDGSTITSKDALNGGDGTDVLQLTAATNVTSASNGAVVTNFETVEGYRSVSNVAPANLTVAQDVSLLGSTIGTVGVSSWAVTHSDGGAGAQTNADGVNFSNLAAATGLAISGISATNNDVNDALTLNFTATADLKADTSAD